MDHRFGNRADRSTAVLLFVLTTLMLLSSVTHALPRYAARYGQNCTLCHVDPSGGGQRTAYASQFIVPQELVVRTSESPPLDTEVAPGITIGGDLRTLFLQGDDGRNEIITMQSDLYVSLQLDDNIVAYIERGRGEAGEAWGLARVLPAQGYLRVGRFMPAHGWRFADHQLTGRYYLLYPDGNERPSVLLDEGIEVGLDPGPLRLQVSMVSGGAGNGESYAARAALRRSFGKLNLVVGTSIRRSQELDGHRQAAGVFGAVAVGSWSWLWQVDETHAPGETGLLVTHEAAIGLIRGLDLRLTYGHQDPDRELVTGSRDRWGLGIDALITPVLGVLVQARRFDSETGPRVSETKTTVGEMVIHVLF